MKVTGVWPAGLPLCMITHLGAHGLHRHVEFVCRPGDATFFGNDPEGVQVLVVKAGVYEQNFQEGLSAIICFYHINSAPRVGSHFICNLGHMRGLWSPSTSGDTSARRCREMDEGLIPMFS